MPNNKKVTGSDTVEASPPSTGEMFPLLSGTKSRWLKLLVLGSGVMAMTIILGAFLFILHLRQDAVKQTEHTLSDIDIVVTDQTERTLQTANLVLKDTQKYLEAKGSFSPATFDKTFGTHEMFDLLGGAARSVTQIDAMGVIDSKGKLVITTRLWPTPKIDLSARDYFTEMRDDPSLESIVSEPIESLDQKISIILIAHRLKAPDGSFAGLLTAVIRVDYFTNLYKDIYLGPGTAIALFHRNGLLLARYPQISAIGHKFPGVLNFMQILKHGDSGVIDSSDTITGTPQFIATRALKNYPLAVNVIMSDDTAFAEWRVQRDKVAVAAAIMVGMLLLLSFILSRYLDAYAKLDEARVETLRAVEGRTRAEAANQAKSLFLANMSHEFRTPLNAIIGFSQIIKDQIMGPIGKPVYAEYAKDIWGAGEHLLEIINNLLDISKIDVSKIDLSDEQIDPAEIVRASIATMRLQAANKKIMLTADIPHGLPFIRGDSLRLRQALINLVSNAVKFTQAGHVTVSVACDTASGFSFTVADTGIGMSPAEIVVAMEPFGQIDSTYSKKNEGTGLGLPLAQRLIELHGGRIEIDSIKGVGTTIVVHLPLDRVVRLVPEVAA
jgi:signal transduction histidine kinase